jgi:hypothetical protein
VRDEWRDAILDGLSAEDATQRLLESFDEYLEEAETEKLFWMALAAAQMETGRLMGWRAVAASAQQAWLMARYRAEEGN